MGPSEDCRQIIGPKFPNHKVNPESFSLRFDLIEDIISLSSVDFPVASNTVQVMTPLRGQMLPFFRSCLRPFSTPTSRCRYFSNTHPARRNGIY